MPATNNKRRRKPTSTRGGAREGAGRPRKFGETVTTTMRLPVEIRAWLERGDESMTETLQKDLRKLKSFRDFEAGYNASG